MSINIVSMVHKSVSSHVRGAKRVVDKEDGLLSKSHEQRGL
jgi:hypothetical protein